MGKREVGVRSEGILEQGLGLAFLPSFIAAPRRCAPGPGILLKSGSASSARWKAAMASS